MGLPGDWPLKVTRIQSVKDGPFVATGANLGRARLVQLVVVRLSDSGVRRIQIKVDEDTCLRLTTGEDESLARFLDEIAEQHRPQAVES